MEMYILIVNKKNGSLNRDEDQPTGKGEDHPHAFSIHSLIRGANGCRVHSVWLATVCSGLSLPLVSTALEKVGLTSAVTFSGPGMNPCYPFNPLLNSLK